MLDRDEIQAQTLCNKTGSRPKTSLLWFWCRWSRYREILLLYSQP